MKIDYDVSTFCHEQMKAVENFEEMMRNIFLPLFQATNSPEEYPNIHKFLQVSTGVMINQRHL